MAMEYRDLIKEAFIDPIRTVVVVDDEFPTLDAMIEKEIEGNGRLWEAAPLEKSRKIVQFCRDKSWLVDIHDGQADLEEPTFSAAHLHHSDLLILDYHLDPGNPTDGTRAVELLRRMASNDHFNLVVVYTSGDESAGGDITKVVNDIAIGLSVEDDSLGMHDRAITQAEDFIAEWEVDDPNIWRNLLGAVDDRSFLRVISYPDDLDWNAVYEWQEFAQLKNLVDSGPKSDKWRLFLKWVLYKKQEELKEKFSGQNNGLLSYHPNDENINWIRTSRLFITVVSKANEPDKIPEKLLDAIRSWEPQPHRLLMSKMRSALDECGVSAEDEVLRNRCLQAGWLEDLASENEAEQLWKLSRTVDRHWERLGDTLAPQMEAFSSKLATNLGSFDNEAMLCKFSPFKENHKQKRDLIITAKNIYACSKPVSGTYLTTGHILQIESKEFWLCLTPACDLVPRQRPSGWHRKLGDNMPFIGVELKKPNRDTALKKAHGGSYLFLDIDDEPLILSFVDEPNPGEAIPNPKTEQFFAADKGRFNLGNPELALSRVIADSGNLKVCTVQAFVIAQLRYEYALNLLQRLGATQTRVGLDFESHSAAQGDNG